MLRSLQRWAWLRCMHHILLARTGLQRAENICAAAVRDFNVGSERERIEKLRYIYRNPVARGLVDYQAVGVEQISGIRVWRGRSS